MQPVRTLPRPEGVIFDMDGVLVDTRMAHFHAYRELAEQHGLTLTEDGFRALFGLENRLFLPRLFGRPLPEAEMARLADWKETRYRAIIEASINPLPGVIALMDRLASWGVPMAVASSAPRANVDQIVHATGIAERVVAWLGAEDATRHKPDPEVFLHAAAHLEVSPANAAVIEDSLYGLEAAKRAGMLAIGVPTTHPASELSLADLVVDTLDHLIPLWESPG